MASTSAVAESAAGGGATLAGLPLFAGLDPEMLRQLDSGSRRLRVVKGEIVFHQGDPSHGFYLLASGQIELSVAAGKAARKVIEVIEPGETFAEAVVFVQLPYPVTATAMVNSALICVRTQAVLGALDASPLVARRMLANLSMRLHGLIRDAETSTLNSATERVVHWLLRELPDPPPSSPAAVLLGTSKTVLASRLNLTPEAFSRALRRLSDAEQIAVRGREIVVADPAGLAARRPGLI
ncbi:MAG: Crp/Fnr family transcriptional regulator [Frankiaceae bacterium]|jgi:CRP-like cAMP-binding protein|nr:Crp/Fnr family transcriptional regulator [Frankiaceae bacterium]